MASFPQILTNLVEFTLKNIKFQNNSSKKGKKVLEKIN
jgi:hypothetical protein